MQGFKGAAQKTLTKSINRNAEEIIINRARDAKMRLKIAGQKRDKKSNKKGKGKK